MEDFDPPTSHSGNDLALRETAEPTTRYQQVTGRLEKALGVSQISLDPQLGATSGNQQQGARLTVRQRVISKLFVTFSTDVTTTQYSAVQLEYRVNRKWPVSGVRDQNGGFGLDVRYHKDF